MDAGGPEPVPARAARARCCSRRRAGSAAPDSPAGSTSRASRRRSPAAKAAAPEPHRGIVLRRAPAAAHPLAFRVDDTMMYVELVQAARARRPRPSSIWRTRSTCRSTGPTGWDERATCTRSPNGTRAWRCTTTCTAGTPISTWARESFTSSTATSTTTVTVPAGYIVAGTGVLQNPEQVLTPAQRTRLAAALKSDSTIAIVTADELASGAARPRQDGTLTWRFRAESVRDVAWAASPDYRWDASALGRDPRAGVLPARRPSDLGRCREDEPLLDPRVQPALVPIPLSADHARSRAPSRAWNTRWSRWRPPRKTRPTSTA